MNRVLEAILGNRSATQVLLFIQQHGEAHASLIAKTFGVSPTGIQRQLKRLEHNAVLTSRLVGRTRLYQFNDSEPTVEALRVFLSTQIKHTDSELNVANPVHRNTEMTS